MPGYINKALARFSHERPSKPQHQPHQRAIPTFGATIQYATPADTSSPLPKEDKKFIQRSLEHSYITVKPSTRPSLSHSAPSPAQATPTEDIMRRTRHLLDCVATHPDAILSYAKSNMIIRNAELFNLNHSFITILFTALIATV